MTDKEIIDTHDIATMFGVADRTVRNWVQKGLLPPTQRLPGKRRWRREAITTWIAAGCDKKLWKRRREE